MVGEHIRALRAGRWTHAIDCGDETVIHLADDGAPQAVRRSYRPQFVSGAEVVEVVRHRERTFPADEVVARAYSRIADPALAAMFGDSASFAEWCATGRLVPASAEPAAAGASGAAEPAARRGPAAARPGRARAPARPKARGAKGAGGRAKGAKARKPRPRGRRKTR